MAAVIMPNAELKAMKSEVDTPLESALQKMNNVPPKPSRAVSAGKRRLLSGGLYSSWDVSL